MSAIRHLARQMLPPVCLTLLRRVRRSLRDEDALYDTFAEALAAAGSGEGCHADAYVEGVVAEFREERERCLRAFPRIDGRSVRHLAAFQHIRDAGGRRPLTVVDLGGQTGIHAHRLRPHLPVGAIRQWDVCETPRMVALARTLGEGQGVRHFDDLAASPETHYDVAFSSGTLACVDEPRNLFTTLAAKARWVVIDRMPLAPFARDRVKVLRRAADTYRAPVPIWFFSESLWLEHFAACGLTIDLRWTVREDRITVDGVELEYTGLLLRHVG